MTGAPSCTRPMRSQTRISMRGCCAGASPCRSGGRGHDQVVTVPCDPHRHGHRIPRPKERRQRDKALVAQGGEGAREAHAARVSRCGSNPRARHPPEQTVASAGACATGSSSLWQCHGSRLTAHGSRLTAHGSRLSASEWRSPIRWRRLPDGQLVRGPSRPFSALLGPSRPFSALLGPSRPFSALLGYDPIESHLGPTGGF